jgi:ABC-2 type transport system ATP-binding protein
LVLVAHAATKIAAFPWKVRAALLYVARGQAKDRVITVSNLSKTFRVPTRRAGLGAAVRALFQREWTNVDAVKDISFVVKQGERVGFLGPNGAGKTTTLKMLAGLLYPSQGKCSVQGHTPHERSDAFLSSIALVLGQKQQLLWDLPPADSFELARALYAVPHKTYHERLDELVSLLGISDVMMRPTRQLSLGERMKCEITLSLLHGPKVMFLDEPTIGLDVAMQADLRAFVRRYNEKENATLVLTSHYMDDVLALCPRVLVIDKGGLIFDGSLETLVRQKSHGKRLTIKGAGLEAVLAQEGLGNVASHQGDRLELEVPREEVARVLARVLELAPGADITLSDPPLEEIFRDLFHSAAHAQSKAP